MGHKRWGFFLVLDVTDRSKAFIGNDIPSELLNGAFVWLSHLISNLAGYSYSTGKSAGIGMPGPLSCLTMELLVLSLFKNISIQDYSLSKSLSELFNGTLLAK